MITIETTVFPEPGATLTHTTHLKSEHADYLNEEMFRHAAWAEKTLEMGKIPGELVLIPVAEDHVLIEMVGGYAGDIVGVVKTWCIDYSDVCPG